VVLERVCGEFLRDFGLDRLSCDFTLGPRQELVTWEVFLRDRQAGLLVNL
jgi:hypothetical protein